MSLGPPRQAAQDASPISHPASLKIFNKVLPFNVLLSRSLKTSVVAGTGLTGGATSGAATVNVIGGTGITCLAGINV